MIRNIFGVLFILSGVGNFVGNIAKASANHPDAFEDIFYGVGFLAFGAFLLSFGRKNKRK